MVLYRKYRPQIFAQVVGQDHVRDPLLAQLSVGKISHAYLFAGPRGTGKTSVARILAKAVNCLSYGASSKSLENNEKRLAISDMRFGEPCGSCESCQAVAAGTHLDLIEIDAASNRGIDEIRDLREKIKLSPAFGRFKVYIIDEAHMLTPEAFNALLKTLEEPPAHAIFILATTEPQKLPPTIISRTTRFDFKVPSVAQIKEKIAMIAKAEGWNLEEEVLGEIAQRAAGAFRDAEVLLEKIALVDSAASLEKTREILGRIESRELVSLLKLLEKGETKQALIWLNNYLEEGGSIRVLVESFLETLRKILLIKAGAGSILEPVTKEELAALDSLAANMSRARVFQLTDLFNKAIEELREAAIPQLPLELTIVEATLGRETEKAKTTEVQNEAEIVEQKTKATKAIKEEKVIDKKSAVEKRPTGEDKLLRKLQKNWGELLKQLKPINSSITLFLKDAKPLDLDEDLLTIEFAYRFHKEKVEERKYREIVEEALAKFAGRNLRIKGVVGEKPPSAKRPDVAKPTPEEKEKVDPVEIFSKLD